MVLKFYLEDLAITVDPNNNLRTQYLPTTAGALAGIRVKTTMPVQRARNYFRVKNANNTVPLTEFNYTGAQSGLVAISTEPVETFLGNDTLLANAKYDTSTTTVDGQSVPVNGDYPVANSTRITVGSTSPLITAIGPSQATIGDVYVANLAFHLLNGMGDDKLFTEVTTYITSLRDEIEDEFNKKWADLVALGYKSVEDVSTPNVASRIVNKMMADDPSRFNAVNLTLDSYGEGPVPFVVGDILYSNINIGVTAAQKNQLSRTSSVTKVEFLLAIELVD